MIKGVENKMTFQTKADYIYELLKKKITSGEIKQGETVTISKIADENEMSTIPVREALKRLEAEGLVDFTAHKGATVTKLNKSKVIEVMKIRAALEGFAAGESVAHINAGTITELRKLNERMLKLAEIGDDEKFVEVNRKFHKVLYSVTGMPMLGEMIQNLWDGGGWSKSIFAYYPNNMVASVAEHEEMIQYMEKKDAEKVESLMRLHKEKSIEAYIEIAGKGESDGKL